MTSSPGLRSRVATRQRPSSDELQTYNCDHDDNDDNDEAQQDDDNDGDDHDDNDNDGDENYDDDNDEAHFISTAGRFVLLPVQFLVLPGKMKVGEKVKRKSTNES